MSCWSNLHPCTNSNSSGASSSTLDSIQVAGVYFNSLQIHWSSLPFIHESHILQLIQTRSSCIVGFAWKITNCRTTRKLSRCCCRIGWSEFGFLNTFSHMKCQNHLKVYKIFSQNDQATPDLLHDLDFGSECLCQYNMASPRWWHCVLFHPLLSTPRPSNLFRGFIVHTFTTPDPIKGGLVHSRVGVNLPHSFTTVCQIWKNN